MVGQLWWWASRLPADSKRQRLCLYWPEIAGMQRSTIPKTDSSAFLGIEPKRRMIAPAFGTRFYFCRGSMTAFAVVFFGHHDIAASTKGADVLVQRLAQCSLFASQRARSQFYRNRLHADRAC